MGERDAHPNPLFLTATHRPLLDLVAGPVPVAAGQGHPVWSARRRRLTPPTRPPVPRRGGFLKWLGRDQRCLLRLQRGRRAASLVTPAPWS